MCGRYNFTVEESDEIREILEQLNAKLHQNAVKNGEIYPTDQAPILIEEEEEVSPVLSGWGFPKYDGKGVIINARAETAFEKSTFREGLLRRRCVIPSTGFYEWNSEKRKFLFRMEDSKTLYMAGIYMMRPASSMESHNELRFVILTTQANASMQEIHNRMPVVLPKQEIAPWIMDQKASGDILRRVPPLLIKEEVGGQEFGYQYKMDFL